MQAVLLFAYPPWLCVQVCSECHHFQRCREAALGCKHTRVCLCVSSTKAENTLIKKVIKVSLALRCQAPTDNTWGAGTAELRERGTTGCLTNHTQEIARLDLFMLPSLWFLLIVLMFFFPLHNSHSQSPQCATKASLQASSLLILVDGNCLLPTQSIDLILIQLLHCSSRMSIVSRWPWNCCPWKQKNWHLLKSIWRNKRNVCCSFLESYPLWEIQAFPVTQCSKPETTMTPGIVMEMQWALRMTKSSSDSP